MPPSELRDFLKHSFGERVVSIADKPAPELPNFIEGFLIETSDVITDEALSVMLRRYYVDVPINVRECGFYWIMYPDKETLLLTITNYSEIGGAAFFGGDPKRGGIGITITSHPEV